MAKAKNNKDSQGTMKKTENNKIIIIGLEKQCFSTRSVFREEEKRRSGEEESRRKREKEERRRGETKREEEHFFPSSWPSLVASLGF